MAAIEPKTNLDLSMFVTKTVIAQVLEKTITKKAFSEEEEEGQSSGANAVDKEIGKFQAEMMARQLTGFGA